MVVSCSDKIFNRFFVGKIHSKISNNNSLIYLHFQLFYCVNLHLQHPGPFSFRSDIPFGGSFLLAPAMLLACFWQQLNVKTLKQACTGFETDRLTPLAEFLVLWLLTGCLSLRTGDHLSKEWETQKDNQCHSKQNQHRILRFFQLFCPQRLASSLCDICVKTLWLSTTRKFLQKQRQERKRN